METRELIIPYCSYKIENFRGGTTIGRFKTKYELDEYLLNLEEKPYDISLLKRVSISRYNGQTIEAKVLYEAEVKTIEMTGKDNKKGYDKCNDDIPW